MWTESATLTLIVLKVNYDMLTIKIIWKVPAQTDSACTVTDVDTAVNTYMINAVLQF